MINLRIKSKIRLCSNGDKIGLLELIVSLMLVICPVFQHYKGFLFNAGWSALILGIPFIVLLCIFKKSSVKLSYHVTVAFSIIILYYFWHLIDHGFSYGDVAKIIILFIYYFAIITSLIRLTLVVKIASAFAVVNVFCLLAQYISYYLFRHKLQLINAARMLSDDNRWLRRLTSSSVNDIFYRPSALFLEPSHLFLFFFPIVLYLLFEEGSDRKSRILGFILIGGICMSTSGFGMVFSIIAIIAFFTMYYKPQYGRGRLANIFNIKSIAFFIIIGIMFVLLVNNVDLVSRTFNRVFFEDHKGYNAIRGRTSSGKILLSQLTILQRIIGVADSMGKIGDTVSGFQAEYWRHGLIGVLLSYCYYFYCLICRKQKVYSYLAIALICLSFFCGHTHREFYMLYFSSFMLSGMIQNPKNAE